jgi:hypothetical protein
MSAYVELLDAILTVVASTDKRITIALREEQARKQNWAKLLAAGELHLPFVIVSCAKISGVSRVPSGNGFAVPVQLHYVQSVGETGDATQDAVERLVTIWQALLRADLPMQSEEGVVIDGSITSPVLATILNVSAPLVGGSLSCEFTVDLTP